MSAGDVQWRAQATIDGLMAAGAEVGLQVAVVDHGRVTERSLQVSDPMPTTPTAAMFSARTSPLVAP